MKQRPRVGLWPPDRGLRRQVGVLVHESHVGEAPASGGHKSRSPGMGLAVFQNQLEAQGRFSHPPPPSPPRNPDTSAEVGPRVCSLLAGSLPRARPGQESQCPLRAAYGSASTIHVSTLPTSPYEHPHFSQPSQGMVYWSTPSPAFFIFKIFFY